MHIIRVSGEFPLAGRLTDANGLVIALGFIDIYLYTGR